MGFGAVGGEVNNNCLLTQRVLNFWVSMTWRALTRLPALHAVRCGLSENKLQYAVAY